MTALELREARSQEELPRYHLSGASLPRIDAIGYDDLQGRYKHRPRLQLKSQYGQDRLRDREVSGKFTHKTGSGRTIALNKGTHRNASGLNDTDYLLQQYATTSAAKRRYDIPAKTGRLRSGLYTKKKYQDPGFPTFDYNGKHSIGAKAGTHISNHDKELVRR